MENPKTVDELKTGTDSVKDNTSGDVIPKPKRSDESGKADITNAQLNTLVERIAKLESGDRRPKIVKPKFNTVLVRFLDGKLVVGYGKSWEEKNAEGSWRLMAEVNIKDGEDIKVKKVDWLNFRQSGEQLEVKIVKVEMNEKVSTKGTTTIKNVDYDSYKTVDTGVEIDMEVVTPEPTYNVEMPDGKIEEGLSHEALN